MKKTGFIILLIAVLFSCTPSQRVEGTYTGDLQIIDVTGTMLATITVAEVDDYHATFSFTSPNFSGSAFAVQIEPVDNRLEFNFSDLPGEGKIHSLTGNYANNILYSNFSVTINGTIRQGNLQNGRKK